MEREEGEKGKGKEDKEGSKHFLFKQKTAYKIYTYLVDSEMCIEDSTPPAHTHTPHTHTHTQTTSITRSL